MRAPLMDVTCCCLLAESTESAPEDREQNQPWEPQLGAGLSGQDFLLQSFGDS